MRGGGVLTRVARRLGLRVHELGDGGVLLEDGERRRSVVRLGDGHLGAHLLVDEPRARRDAAMLQKRLSEYLVREQVGWVLRATEATLVLDVGANVGQFGRSLRRAGYRGRIASFEPVRASYEKLARAAAADPDWQAFHCALGTSDGSTEINVDPGTLSSLLPPTEFGRAWSDRLSETRTETITVRRLPSVLDEAAAGLPELRAYLKMDTQGYDAEVFEGARPVLDRVVGLQSELACLPLYDGAPRLPEMLTTYEAAGFETAGMFVVSHDRPTLRAVEFDVVMVRPEEVRRPRG